LDASIRSADSRVYLTDDRPRVSTIPTRTPPSGTRAPDDQACLLLHRMADGDESALAQLYDQWSRRVHTLAFWILKDSDDAEDVVEETFWQLWRTAGQFDRARASAGAWLMLIARSRAVDRLRAQRRRVERTAAAVSDLPDSLEPDPAECDPKLAEALGALPPEQREALQLAFFAGLSHSEIAERTAQPLGTIKTRIRLAMDKLRQSLGFLRDQVV
jgi:RNA polymerase sigma-70 factor, ECF subfamily